MKMLVVILALTITSISAHASTSKVHRNRVATPDDVVALMTLVATEQLPGHQDIQNCLNEFSASPGKVDLIKVTPGSDDESDTKYTMEKSGGSSYLSITAGEGSLTCTVKAGH